MSAGPAITAIGLAMFARIGHSGDYLTEVLPAVVIYGLGLAITVAPLTSTVLAAVPASHPGMASAATTPSRAHPSSAQARAWSAVCLRRLPYATPARAKLASLAELPCLTMWASQGTARLGACHRPAALHPKRRPVIPLKEIPSSP